MLATQDVLDIRLNSGQIRLISRAHAPTQIVGYAYHLDLPIFLDRVSPNLFHTLRNAVNTPTHEESIAIVREFVMGLKHNNATLLKEDNPERLTYFKGILSNDELRVLNQVRPINLEQSGNNSRLEQLKADLRNHVVFLVFQKKNGEVRPMVATLNADLIDSYYKPGARAQRFTRDTKNINLFDLAINDWRKANISRLYPMDAPDVADFLHQGMTGKNAHNLMWFNLPLNTQTSDVTESNLEPFLTRIFGAKTNPSTTAAGTVPYAHNKYSIEQMIDVLKHKVVRLVFKKKGSEEIRTMYATRNATLIQMYEKVGGFAESEDNGRTPEENRQRMIESHLIRVLDLEAQDWRYATVDNLLAADPIYKEVPSWVEYDTEIGDWFATMRGTKTVQETYSGHAFTGSNFLRADLDRLKFESRLFLYQEVKAEMQRQTEVDNSHLKRLAQAEALLQTAFAQVKSEGYTSQDLEAFDYFKQFGTRLEADFKNKVDTGAVNFRLVLSEQKALSSNYILRLSFNWGRDVYFIHPRFIIGATSHKVYADRTGVFADLERARLSDADRTIEPLLEKLIPLVTGRRRQDLLTKPVEGDDIRRVKRIAQLVKTHDQALKEEGISISQNKKLPAQFKVMIDRKQFILFNHEYVYHLPNKQFMFIRTKEVTYTNTLEPMISGMESKKARKVLELMYIACDLRRAVVDDSGKHI